MTVTLSADFQQRERIVFTARSRSFVNVRRALDDGPIGFTSIELLLVAFGNCSLGTLLGQPELADVPFSSVTATIEGETETDPPRLSAVRSTVRLATPEPKRLEALLPELRQRVLNCPTCNSLVATKEIAIEVTAAAPSDTAEPGEATVIACALPAPS